MWHSSILTVADIRDERSLCNPGRGIKNAIDLFHRLHNVSETQNRDCGVNLLLHFNAILEKFRIMLFIATDDILHIILV